VIQQGHRGGRGSRKKKGTCCRRRQGLIFSESVVGDWEGKKSVRCKRSIRRRWFIQGYPGELRIAAVNGWSNLSHLAEEKGTSLLAWEKTAMDKKKSIRGRGRVSEEMGWGDEGNFCEPKALPLQT